jgi:hypothetical protein
MKSTVLCVMIWDWDYRVHNESIYPTKWTSIISVMTMLNSLGNCILMFVCYFIYKVFYEGLGKKDVNYGSCDVKVQLTYRHSLTYTVVMVQKIHCKSNFVQVGTEYTYGELCMFIQGNPVEIQTEAHWNPITSSMSALPPVLLPSSILPPLSSHAFISPWKKQACFNPHYFFKIVCLKFRS